MKVLSLFFLMGALGFAVENLWACPSGQTCPVSLSECIADPSLCVADSSSSSSSSTSSEPTTTKDQLGITLDPENYTFIRVFNFNNDTQTYTFYDPRPEFGESKPAGPREFPFNDIPTAIPMYGEWVVNS